MKSFLTDRAFKNVTSRWVIFFIEQILSALAVIFTILMVFRIRVLHLTLNDIIVMLAVNAVISSASMLINKTHHGLIRYSELRDIYTVLRFSALHFILWMAVLPLFTSRLGVGIAFEVATLMINTIVITLLMASFRLLVKEVYQRAVRGLVQKDNVLIYGAGDIGLATKKAIEFDKKSNCRVVAFIDDSPEKVGKVIPPLSQWIKGIFNRRQLKELSIESLLGREKIELLAEKSRMDLEGKVMLVTGAAGSIGSDICRQLCRYKLGKLVLLDQSETGLHEILLELGKLDLEFELCIELASIREKKRIDNIFRKHKPHFVFHAAAYKHVPILEDYPSEVALTNVFGTRNLADAAQVNQVEKFVMISTDKAVNPTNLMGACKRIGEIYVQSLSSTCQTQFITTRFGNVLGSNGSVVPLFKQQIAQGGPLTVTHPQITRYFMTIPEASSLVLEAAVIGKGGEIFVFDMGKPVKILELARKMIQLAGFRPDHDIAIEFSGLRPGEKMYEELFKSSENLLPTHHPKIMKAQRSDIDPQFADMLERFIDAAKECDDKTIRTLIRLIVPEYRQHKSFEHTNVKMIPIVFDEKNDMKATAAETHVKRSTRHEVS